MDNYTTDAIKERVYGGIDVHKKTYSVTALGQSIGKKTASMSANPHALIAFLEKHFSNKEINTVYEAGFCGFHLRRQLEANKIKNIIVNPIISCNSDSVFIKAL